MKLTRENASDRESICTWGGRASDEITIHATIRPSLRVVKGIQRDENAPCFGSRSAHLQE